MWTITSNYHTHTYRCGHAIGEDEEYVKAAIKAGIKILGFTDHVPWPDFVHPGMRVHVDLLENCIKSLTFLKNKYKNEIEIHIGFEAEYVKEYMPFYEWMKKQYGIEYYILGQHCTIHDDEFYFYGQFHNDQAKVKEYVNDLIKGMESGLFSYVCHPDLFLEFYDKDDYFVNSQIRQICIKAKELNLPLEFNLGHARNALRNGYPHDGNFRLPFYKFWKVVGEMDIPCVIGVDAHDPNDFFVDHSSVIEEFKNKYNLHFIDFHL